MQLRLYYSAWRAALAALVICGIAGCGAAGAKDLTLDQAVARESLTTFLEAWKKGDRLDVLKNQTPEIIAGDPEYAAGTRLVSYRLLEPVTDDGANLHAPVELELEDGSGRRSKHEVVYIIGTSPTITIFPQ